MKRDALNDGGMPLPLLPPLLMLFEAESDGARYDGGRRTLLLPPLEKGSSDKFSTRLVAAAARLEKIV